MSLAFQEYSNKIIHCLHQ